MIALTVFIKLWFLLFISWIIELWLFLPKNWYLLSCCWSRSPPYPNEFSYFRCLSTIFIYIAKYSSHSSCKNSTKFLPNNKL